MSTDDAPVTPSVEKVFRIDVSHLPADQLLEDPGDILVRPPRAQSKPKSTQD